MQATLRTPHLTSRRGFRWAVGTTALLVLLCGLPAGKALAAGATAASAPLVLSATGKQGDFLGKPSCWVSFQVHNNSDKEVTLFSTNLLAAEAGTGRALKTVSMNGVGIAGGKLAAHASSKPWPLNLQEVTCDKVVVRFSKLFCGSGGGLCAPIAVEQKGVMSIEAPKQ